MMKRKYQNWKKNFQKKKLNRKNFFLIQKLKRQIHRLVEYSVTDVFCDAFVWVEKEATHAKILRPAMFQPTQKYIETKTREINNELENYKRKCKQLNAKNRALENKSELQSTERDETIEMIQSLRSELREKERLNQDLKNKIKNIPEK